MSAQDSILLKLATIADDYTEKSNTKVLMVAIETANDGEPLGMTLQKNANPVLTLGMIDALMNLLEEERERAISFLHKTGDRHESTSSTGLKENLKNISPKTAKQKLDEVISAFELVKEFKALKEEGDKIKDTDPERLIAILARMREISQIINQLGDDDSSDNDNQNPLDKFKDTF